MAAVCLSFHRLSAPACSRRIRSRASTRPVFFCSVIRSEVGKNASFGASELKAFLPFFSTHQTSFKPRGREISCAASEHSNQQSQSRCPAKANSRIMTGAAAMTVETFVEAAEVTEARSLVSELCRQFYTLGWVSGTGGSISIKVNDTSRENKDRIIVMAPSGVQKERMEPDDMYVLAPDGEVLSQPVRKPAPHKPPKCSECGPLFLKITHMEMIKGIAGHGYYDELVVPIIENTAREYELTESLAAAMEAYPKATAVLVRNHGLYVWGDNWIQAKTQAECYHYLFDAAIRLHKMGLDPADPLHGPLKSAALDGAPAGSGHANGSDPGAKKRKLAGGGGGGKYPPVIVLDIEGTTTPISFVADVLFPYARSNVGPHLRSTYGTPETQADIQLLREQVELDLAAQVAGAVPVPPQEAGQEAVVAALEQNVAAMIAADRKITALKQLQGHIWRVGYAKGELLGEFFEDVPQALSQWHQAASKIYIYSSGSREAQRLIFGYTNVGDLRPYLSGYFDTTTGPKREARSYAEIALSVGVDSPASITFCTDILEEAVAAKAAGVNAVLLSRPGNAPVPSNHGFRVLTSLADL
eukprot:jgi/Mesen1/10275/ME000785S09552